MYARVLMLSAALALTSTIARTQQTQPQVAVSTACPIAITNINPTGNDSFGNAFLSGGNAHAKDGRMFVLKVRNTSGKDIQGMKFQAGYYDATHDLDPIPVEWDWVSPVNAGQEKSYRWDNDWRDKAAVGWQVRLTKVLFSDGTKWQPAEGQTCSGEYWRDKHHKS